MTIILCIFKIHLSQKQRQLFHYFILFSNYLNQQQRHRNDALVNNRQSWVLRDGKLVEERWHKVVVGDIIKMENNQFVAVSFTVCLHTLMRWIKVYYVVKKILCHAKKKIGTRFPFLLTLMASTAFFVAPDNESTFFQRNAWYVHYGKTWLQQTRL